VELEPASQKHSGNSSAHGQRFKLYLFKVKHILKINEIIKLHKHEI
jgi:hypothetical protein